MWKGIDGGRVRPCSRTESALDEEAEKAKKERGQDKEDDRISTVRKALGRLEFQIAFPPIRRGPCRGNHKVMGSFE